MCSNHLTYPNPIMSNYAERPSITDSCIVCMEEYGNARNIHIPKSCPHPICKKCVKRCNECPLCKVKYPKKEVSDIQRRIKHVIYLRRTLYRFTKDIQKITETLGDQYRIQYDLIYNTHVHALVSAEKELQDQMTVPQRRIRRISVLHMPYHTEDLNYLMIRYELAVPPES